MHASDPSVPPDAGGVVSSPRNLAVFIRALFQGRLIKPATLQPMLSERDRFGAFHSGSHRFCLTSRQPESCQTYRFANAWERTPQGLRHLRTVSYGH